MLAAIQAQPRAGSLEGKFPLVKLILSEHASPNSCALGTKIPKATLPALAK